MSKQSVPYSVGPWGVKNVDTAYDNPWIQIAHHDVVRPDGGEGIYGVVHFKNLAIGILPIDAQGRTILVGQHRFPHDKYSWELPEGGGPLAQSPIESAQRELMEETGFTADQWTELMRFDVSNSVTDEHSVCFIATGLTAGEAKPEATEQLQQQVVPFRELHKMVLSGEISDSLTIAMVLMAEAKALRKALPLPICELILGS